MPRPYPTIFAATASLLLSASTALAYPSPRIPQDQIPADAPAEVRGLIEKLYSADDYEAAAAAVSLGELGEAASPAAPFLASMLETKHPRGPKEAATALKRIGKASVEPAILALQLGDHYARANAADVLAALKDPRSIDPLVTVYDDTQSRQAADALRACGDAARERILAGMKDRDPDVRRRCVHAAGIFAGPQVTEALNGALADEDAPVRAAALRAMVPPAERKRRPRGQVDSTARLSPAILRAAEDRDVEVRREAIRILADTQDASAFDALAKAASDPDALLARAAIHALGGIDHPQATPLLLKLLSNPDPQIGSAAAEELGASSDARTAAEPLAEALKSRDAQLREKAANALGALKAAAAAPALVERMHDDDALVRRAAVLALAAIGGTTGTEALAKSLEDPDETLRVEAVRALSSLGRVGAAILVKACGNDQAIVRRTALEALADLNDPASQDVLVAGLSDRDPGVRQMALRVVAHRGITPPPETIRPFIDNLPANQRPNDNAIRILGRFKDPANLDLFLSGLNQDGRDACLEAIAQLGPLAVEPLARRLGAEKDAGLRRSILQALGRIGTPDATKVVSSRLDDADPAVREEAARVLGGRNGSNPAPPDAAAAALRNDPSSTQWIDALVRGGGSSIDAVSPLLKDPDPQVRIAAIGVLGRIADPKATAALPGLLADPDAGVRAAVADALAQSKSPESVKAILPALADSSALVRESAARALGECGDTATPLMKVLRDTDWHVRRAAAESLGRLKSADALAALKTVAGDLSWQVRRAAAMSLGATGQREAVPPLLSCLADGQWLVRAEAHRSLQHLSGQTFDADPARWQQWWDTGGTFAAPTPPAPPGKGRR